MRKRKMKRWLIGTLALFLCVFFSVIYYESTKSLPVGVPFEGKVHQVPDGSISFLYDLTYKDGNHEKTDQHMFKAVFEAIEDAEEFIVLDFFLYNDYYDHDQKFPPLSSTLTEKLIAKKRENPNIQIVLITDEINTSYNSHKNWQFENLKKNGIDVLMTDVDPLRDSNPLYTAVWRMFFQWFGQEGKGIFPNAMADDAPNMTGRSYLKLLNIKANHRKTVATEKTALILSGNPHDASAFHSNIGFRIDGPIVGDLLESEQAAANLAGGKKLPRYGGNESSSGNNKVQLITEGKVLEKTLSSINSTGKGDELWLSMFYLAERKVIDALLDADKRGVHIKIILDPNENAFGSQKTGLPNKPVAQELDEETDSRIKIRWYNTGQEQYHTKLLYIKKKDKVLITGGSTNFTARNLDNFNLETNVYIETPVNSRLAKELDHYFKRQWTNEDGQFTVDLKENVSPLTFGQRVVYFLQKVFYFTTF
ncbi:phospholipase D family protein [Siminovitchia fortis]|uniref:Phospholipase n=1 Tax=Siminovitchia fortis TaxID=254758 RepID=A0A451GCN4_9BACI|nr:phospholipase D family protein [Siminovitchia fortis]RWR13132.1 phospholipase [Siminovitchia fortis]WHY82085.1 phospholipase D family protein [Siminovitchia fortis]